MEDKNLSVVGEYTETFNDLTAAALPCGPIYMSEGFSVHIQKRHPGHVKYIERVPEIITSPDYIGCNPKEPDSIELVKVLDENILLAIKLDKKQDYLYVASLYDVNTSKIERRLSGGRLKAYDKTCIGKQNHVDND